MPRKKITHRGTPGLGAVWAVGPGFGLAVGASLRKATLTECDPAPAVCTSLLTIEIFGGSKVSSPVRTTSLNTSRNAAATLPANEVPAEASDKITMPLRARKIDVSASGKKQRNVSDWAA
jgi:hypothetical protein